MRLPRAPWIIGVHHKDDRGGDDLLMRWRSDKIDQQPIVKAPRQIG
jgi:hypothetical protein